MVKKLILMAMIGLNMVIVAPVFAQSDAKIPDLNPMCWKKNDCDAARRKMLSEGAASKSGEYFFQDPPCEGGDENNPWGKCLAGSAAKTYMSFGGERDFSSIGTFITKNYNFAITVAGILAVIVIIMSGFQWTISAGNPEIINKAKRRIGNALVGLSIAYGSYFILYTINPSLVSFDYLKVWMIRPMDIVPKFCSSVSTTGKFALAADSTRAEQAKDLEFPTTQLTYSPYTNQDSTYFCGKRFWVENAGKSTCFGDYCEPGSSCINIDLNSTSTYYYCRSVSIVGQVKDSSLKAIPCSGYESYYLDGDNNGEIYKVCQLDGVYSYARTNTNLHVNNMDSTVSSFMFDRVGSADAGDSSCGNGGSFIGYALALEFNVNCSLIDSVHIVNRSGRDMGKLSSVIAGPAVSKEDVFTADEVNSGFKVFVDLANFKE